VIRRLSTAVLVAGAAVSSAVAWRVAQHTACPACGRFARLNIKDGDMLFLRVPAGLQQESIQRQVEEMRHALSHRGITPSMIWILAHDCEISALGVEEMRSAGWIPLPPTAEEMARAELGLRDIERRLVS
jgi:hypothetical protein